MIYYHYSNMRWRKRRLNPRRNFQLLNCPISKNSCTLVITTLSIGRTLLIIIWLNIFWGTFETYMGKYARNKTKVKFSDFISSASKKSAKSRKKLRQMIFSRIHTKAVQVQKQIFFLETFGPSEINPGKSKQFEENIKWIISIMFMLLLISQQNYYPSNYPNILQHMHFLSFLHSSKLDDNKLGHDWLAFK